MMGIDLFAGAGGMSLGAAQAGIDVILAIEKDSHSAYTYAANHPHTKVLVEDICAIGGKEIGDVLGEKALRNGKNMIVFGGPPCQGFSTSNQRTRNERNTCNWQFLEFIRIVKILSPDWVVFENVKGIMETAKGVFLDMILESFEKTGYTTSCHVLNAQDFGVPQKRARLFIIGSKHGMSISMPASGARPPTTVKEAISDLPILENGADENVLPYRCAATSKYARELRKGRKRCANHLVTKNASHIIERYKHIPQGGNWECIPKRLMRNYSNRDGCHTGIYHRLCENEPAIVIGNFRKNMLIHPTQDRGLSVREAARLQSFPDWYEFRGSIGFQQQQVGNAVPPYLSKAVFNSILNNRGKPSIARSHP